MLRKIFISLIFVASLAFVFLAYHYYKKPLVVTKSVNITKMSDNNNVKNDNVIQNKQENNLVKETKQQEVKNASQGANEQNLSKSYVEKIIKEYLEKNPEIVVKSIDLVHKKKIAESLKKTKEYLKDNRKKIEEELSPPVLGNLKGDVSIVFFFDYSCSYCKKSNNYLNKILSSDRNVRVILRPIAVLGEASVYISKVALSVYKMREDIFPDFHNDLMLIKLNQGEKLEGKVKELLEKYNIEYSLVENEINSYGVKEILKNNYNLAENIGIKGAPSFVINGEFYSGMMPVDNMKKIIMELRKKQK